MKGNSQMNNLVDSYRISAKHYDDAYAVKADLTDLPFYLELAKRIGGPVLEIACGTGRILLPTASAGIEIHGLDNSSNMLRILKNHLAERPAGVQQRVSLFEGDMRNFSLPHKYPLVTMPFRSMQHMHTVRDQVAALGAAASHLSREGLLALDVFYPKYDGMFSRFGEEILELEWSPKTDPSKIVRRYFRKDSLDKIHQTFTVTFIFRTYQGSALLGEEFESLTLSYYTYPHLQALFLMNGLEPVEEYGSFDKKPLDNNAEQMIFVLRKKVA
jgi:SAM-dependent methyltransferase